MNENNINIEVVVARYNEDLSWTLEEPFNKFQYTVYNKGYYYYIIITKIIISSFPILKT